MYGARGQLPPSQKRLTELVSFVRSLTGVKLEISLLACTATPHDHPSSRHKLRPNTTEATRLCSTRGCEHREKCLQTAATKATVTHTPNLTQWQHNKDKLPRTRTHTRPGHPASRYCQRRKTPAARHAEKHCCQHCNKHTENTQKTSSKDTSKRVPLKTTTQTQSSHRSRQQTPNCTPPLDPALPRAGVTVSNRELVGVASGGCRKQRLAGAPLSRSLDVSTVRTVRQNIPRHTGFGPTTSTTRLRAPPPGHTTSAAVSTRPAARPPAAGRVAAESAAESSAAAAAASSAAEVAAASLSVVCTVSCPASCAS